MRLLTVLFTLLFAFNLSAQPAAQKAYQKEYAKNIKKSRINNVYIPKSLDDAFQELSQLAQGKSIAKFKNAPEDVIARKLHFGLGKWISYNWNLDRGSRYGHYLKSLGLKNTDDMVQFTIVSFHRHLNNKSLDIEAQVKKFDEIIQKRLEARRARSTTRIISVKKD